MRRLLYIIIYIAVCSALFSSCSTTSRISDDDPLYTGIKEINIDGKSGTDAEAVALEELEGALAFEPNNSLFGSSTMRSPLPIGLWIYNSMASDSLKGIKKWFYNSFSAVPKTISSVTPDTRVKVATNVLQNYGYFQADVDYRLITSTRNPRKQKIAYDVKLGHPYSFESIQYSFKADSLVLASLGATYLHEGSQFSVANLQLERSRLTTMLHDNGYYYYRPDYIKYYADSVNSPGNVKLLVTEDLNMPERAKRQWKIGKIDVFFRDNTTGTQQRRGQNMYNDTIHRPRFDVAYQGKRVPIRIPIVMRNFKFWTGMMYSEDRVNRTLAQMSSLNTFASQQFTFTPADSTDSCSVLNVRFEATMDKLLDTELEFNFTQKSNSQIGPDLAITLSKRNAFRNGEKLALTLRGSYYWQLRGRSKDKINNLDSYDWGADLSLSYPWLLVPGILNKAKGFRYPTSTKVTLSFTRNNIAKAYRYNQFGLGWEYNYQTSKHWTHTFTPLKIEIKDLRDVNYPEEDTTKVSSLVSQKLTKEVFQDAFVPSMQYELRYDNSVDKNRRVFTNVSFNVKEAGLITNSLVSLFTGKGFSAQGKTFIKEYSQYIKGQIELRNRFMLTPKSCLATRALIAAAYAYGNSFAIPINDKMYSGGAYSLRAFPARSLGPGRFVYSRDDLYFHHSGAMRLELNGEYRFPLFGNLYGALFLDAGNVWEIQGRITESQAQEFELTDEQFETANARFLIGKHFLNDIALGTGFGFRYDMEFLVLRLDIGIALHAPYKTSRKGYYNIPRFFKDGVGINFAVGYPF